MKHYGGRTPDPDDGWVKIEGQIFEGVRWNVYIKHQDHSDEWVNVKIAAEGRAAYKANYWFSKNLQSGQIAYARDFALLRETRPEVHCMAEGLLTSYKPNAMTGPAEYAIRRMLDDAGAEPCGQGQGQKNTS